MARRRVILPPEEASSEGVRRLRVMLTRNSYGAIARKLRVDESTIRKIASEQRKPSPELRGDWQDTFGFDPAVWDEPPARDAYVAAEDPATTKRR